MKKIALLFIAALMVFSLFSCGNDKDILESTKTEKTVLMTVDGFDVPLELYRYVALNSKADYEASRGGSADIWLGESGAALIKEINAHINDIILTMYTTRSLAAKYGISPEDEYIKDTVDILMDNVYEGYGYDYIAYKNDLGAVNMTDSVYRFITANDLLAEELYAKLIESGEILSGEDELRGVINSDEFVRVKQILLTSENGNTDEENLALAQKLLDKLAHGDSFEDLVQKYGKDLYMFNNDNGYYICRGNRYEEFEEAAFSLEVGEVSGIIKTPAGYSIIKRYEKDSDYITENFEDLCEEYKKGKYNLILEEHKATITVEPTDEMKNYSIFNLDSID
ncbi:MAG: hypothetical protein E7627_08810 [Ruminococcaceae bacterium]|nr:hypothetical protein [Oscillospiraceae bacterium]